MVFPFYRRLKVTNNVRYYLGNITFIFCWVMYFVIIEMGFEDGFATTLENPDAMFKNY